MHMTQLEPVETVDPENLSDEYIDMGLRGRILHDKEANTDPSRPNRHVVVLGDTAVVLETE